MSKEKLKDKSGLKNSLTQTNILKIFNKYTTKVRKNALHKYFETAVRSIHQFDFRISRFTHSIIKQGSETITS